MQVTLEKSSETLASILVKIQEADYSEQFNNKLKEYAKKAQIKGFRPGKVPLAVAKSMVGDSILADEVYKILSESLNKYIKENEIDIIGEPLPNSSEFEKVVDWKSQKEFDFKYDIGIVPNFKAEVSDKLKFTKYEIEIEESTLQETIDNLLQQNGEPTYPDITSEDDFLTGTIKKEGDETEGSQTGIPLSRVVKKELKNFIDKKIGDTLVFDIQKAFESSDHVSHILGVSKESAAEAKGNYTFTLTKITRTSPAEINQAFFDKILGKDTVKNESEFKEKVLEILTQNYNNDSKSVLHQEIQKELVSKANIEVSEDFFKRWLLESNKESLEPSYLDENYGKYEEQLKWTLLKNKIAQEFDLKVENEEVRAAAFEQLRMQYLGGMEIGPEMQETFNSFVDKFLKENKGENYMQLFEQVLTQKVFNNLEEKVSLTNKKVKSEEFKKIVEKQ